MGNNVEFSDKEIRTAIEQQITGPAKGLLADAIFGLLGDSNDWKKGILLKAAMGIKEECELILNEEYYVNPDHISGYSFDQVAMKEAGLINSDNKIKCTLVQFKPYEFAKYIVKHEWIDKADGVRQTRDVGTHFQYLSIVEEFPEDLI